MSDLCLNLLTRINTAAGDAPLDRIWSLDLWLASLARIKAIHRLEERADYQRFDLVFDAGRAQPDRVSVERHRRENAVEVVHLVPPPGVKGLTATWWTEPAQGAVLFARRRILLAEDDYSPALARKMFGLLRENVETLIAAKRRPSCALA